MYAENKIICTEKYSLSKYALDDYIQRIEIPQGVRHRSESVDAKRTSVEQEFKLSRVPKRHFYAAVDDDVKPLKLMRDTTKSTGCTELFGRVMQALGNLLQLWWCWSFRILVFLSRCWRIMAGEYSVHRPLALNIEHEITTVGDTDTREKPSITKLCLTNPTNFGDAILVLGTGNTKNSYNY